MTYEKTEWVRCRRGSPCPVCERETWCSVSADGKAVMCGRVPSQKRCGDAGWLHKLDSPIQPPEQYHKKKRPMPTPNFFRMQKEFRVHCTDLSLISKQLGVTSGSLDRLGIGYFAHSYTFPMRNCKHKIVGIKRRLANGKKICIRGSHLGLYLPLGLDMDSKNVLYICEGETDAAALLSLGFDVIGRPACRAGTKDVVGLLEGCEKHVVIMTDKDEWKQRPDGTPFKPGQEGAFALTKIIKSKVKSLKIIRPGKYKDIRQWLNNGATAEKVQCVVDNTRFI